MNESTLETTRNARPIGKSDPAIIEEALSATNGEKFRRLWNGNTGEYNGDASAADIANCAKRVQVDERKMFLPFLLADVSTHDRKHMCAELGVG